MSRRFVGKRNGRNYEVTSNRRSSVIVKRPSNFDKKILVSQITVQELQTVTIKDDFFLAIFYSPMEGKHPPRTHLVPARSSCLKGMGIVSEDWSPVCSKSWSPMYSDEGLDPPQMFWGLVKYAVITYMFSSEIHGDFKACTPGADFGSLR